MSGTVAITIKVNDAESAKLKSLQRQLDDLKKHGTGGGSWNPFGGWLDGANKAHGATVEFEGSARSLHEALHVIEPVLGGLGLGLGNLGGVASAARFSIGAFSAALIGALLVALEKVAEASERAKKSLADLGATPALVKGLQDFSQKTGVPFGQIATQYGAFREAQGSALTEKLPDYFPQGPGSGRTVKGGDDVEAFKTQYKFTRLGAGSLAGGEADQAKLNAAIKAHHGLTAEDVEGLSTGTVEQIAKLPGIGIRIDPNSRATPKQQVQNFLKQRGPDAYISGDAISRGLEKTAPQINEDFAKLKPGLDEEVGKIKESLNKLALTFGDAGLTTALDKLAKAIDAYANLIGKHNPVATGASVGAAAGAVGGFVLGGPPGAVVGAVGGAAGGAAVGAITDQEALDKARADYAKMHKADNQARDAVKNWLNDTQPQGLAAGGLIMPHFADGGHVTIDQLLKQIAGKRGPHGQRNLGIGPILDLIKLTSQFGIHGLAGGGLLSGPGSDTSDNLAIWTSPGEYVLKASAVRRIGVDRLDRMNNGYADGGAVGDIGAWSDGGSTPPSGGTPSTVVLQLGSKQYPIPTHDHSIVERLSREAVDDRILQIVTPQDAVR